MNMTYLKPRRHYLNLIALASWLACTLSGFAPPATAADGAASGVTRAQFETRQQKRFFRADKDADSLVSRDEFTAARTSGNAERLGKRFSRMDGNKDGSVDAKELSVSLERRFKRLDADGNGILARGERPAVIKKNQG
jgi:Ca2+-binding EF-hand superfamily protein